MELEWRNRTWDLVAVLDCPEGKGKLQGGGIGWFEVATVEWRFDWKLIVRVSITEPKAGKEYPIPRSGSVKIRPAAKRFFGRSPECFVTFIVEKDVVEIVFPIPECIVQFRESRGWGCTDGGSILLSSGLHHCQARLEARRPNYKADLRKVEGGIDFLELKAGGHTSVIGHLEDSPESKEAQREWEKLVKEGLRLIR